MSNNHNYIANRVSAVSMDIHILSYLALCGPYLAQTTTPYLALNRAQ